MSEQESARSLLHLVIEHSPAGILTDIDGTISRIAPHPESAEVDEAARLALSRLSDSLALVGAITGRAANDAYRLVSLDNLVYSGNHGMELWRNGHLEQSPLATQYVPQIEEMLKDFQTQCTLEGLYLENKGLTASIHYREAVDPETTSAQILSIIGQLAKRYDVVVTQGRMVIELRPPVELSKGTSVIELIEEYDLRSAAFLGDDLTDVDAFVALRKRREETGGHFYGIGVTGDATPTAVFENADALVEGVDGVVELLSVAI
jgi:trehalose 6-phosphate phosphatase